MPTTYEAGSDEVNKIIKTILTKHHLALSETGCTVGAIFAINLDGPAVKAHGSPALAKVRIVSSDKKVNNFNDAEIIIDSGEWSSLDDEQRAALIDHELSHLRRREYTEKQLAKLRKGDPGHIAWKLDEHGRPRLGTVPADFTPGDAFADVIARHGKKAVEFVTAKRFEEFAKRSLEK
jgi:hypothetical protein